ncbi:hypothetical protein ROS62_16405 [Streptomyces sp. DSM 41972]|uniref:VOC domain-containing protein n=1 Tax=Streptomyces althioticus subsp. attaecolombicae TaxID=3075534 RepID=A0ABU3I0A2_9ACTN|nr:hypothetical protein [Streptomyces sp. DSM 41972]
MSVEFNHTVVLTPDRERSARFAAEILGLETGRPAEMFLPVTTANGVTLDFATVEGDIPVQHYAFLVAEEEFDAILARLVAARVPLQADPHGRYPRRLNPTTARAHGPHAPPRCFAHRRRGTRMRTGPVRAVRREADRHAVP